MSEPVAVALGTRLDQVAAALSTCEARNARAATESQLLGSARRTRPRERRGALDELSVATTASASVATAVTITAAAASATIRATGEARSTRFVTRRAATPRSSPPVDQGEQRPGEPAQLPAFELGLQRPVRPARDHLRRLGASGPAIPGSRAQAPRWQPTS
jgi:hypothetical protein